MTEQDNSDERKFSKLREQLRLGESWKPNQFHASEVAFLSRLIDEARSERNRCREAKAIEAQYKDAAVADLAVANERIARLEGALRAAAHALRSYQFGNVSTELAESVADRAFDALGKEVATPNTAGPQE